MSFPLVGTKINGNDIEGNTNLIIQLQQPNQLKLMRKALLGKLFEQPGTLPQGDERVAQQLAQIAQVLGRSAGNEPTIYDNGSSRSSASGNANAFTQQVERALTKVLGRTPGGGYDGFVNALNSTFPTDAYGKVVMTPTRGVVSLSGNGNYSNTGNGFYSSSSLGNYPATESGYSPTAPTSIGVGQLSVEQATLFRLASINAADALLVLDSLRPFDPEADIEHVEALRALIRSQITSLVDEFGRIDEPRKQRVETYLETLKSSVTQFGDVAKLIATSSPYMDSEPPVTLSDETQVAGFKLLDKYVKALSSFWKQFRKESKQSSYSERLSRAHIILPVISDSNTSFMAAMDSIGFTASERRSEAAKFSNLADETTISLPFANGSSAISTFTLKLPDITVNDFNEWVERFASFEAPSILSASGKFGLDFVLDQADTLFWVIGIVLSQLNPNSKLGLARQLAFERVKQTLGELSTQLDALANPGGTTTPPSNPSSSAGALPTPTPSSPKRSPSGSSDSANS
jgi:hypothetical protein